MVWKPKEKELTKEEAIALAKKDLAPYWIKSAPLFTATETGGVVSLFALDRTFEEKAWVIVTLDPTRYESDLLMDFVKTWSVRYVGYGVGFSLVLTPNYPFIKEQTFLNAISDRTGESLSVSVDHDGLISKALGGGGQPKIVMFAHSKKVFEGFGIDSVLSAEEKVQSFLRSKDPGLSLLPIFNEREGRINDGVRIEFGRGKSDFKKLGITFLGKWQQDEDKVTTSDAQTQIIINSRAAFLSVLAQPQCKPPVYGKIVVEIDDQPIISVFSAEDVASSDGSPSTVELHSGWYYRLIKDLPSDAKRVALIFPEADKGPISIYALQFGSSAP